MFFSITRTLFRLTTTTHSLFLAHHPRSTLALDETRARRDMLVTVTDIISQMVKDITLQKIKKKKSPLTTTKNAPHLTLPCSLMLHKCIRLHHEEKVFSQEILIPH